MSNRNASHGVGYGGVDLDEGRFEAESDRAFSGRPLKRGYDEEYRGYPLNYDRGQKYNRDQERRSAGWDDRWETPSRRGGRSFYGQGPQRSHLRCRDIMTRQVTTCDRGTPIYDVARRMRDEDVGALPLVDQTGKLEGIVTDRDIVVSGLNSSKTDAELKAGDCMSTDLFTANQNDRVVDVIREMGDHKVRRVPVVDSRNRLVGIISMADISIQTNRDMELADSLEEISQPPSWFSRLANLFH
jgi:CBS domain-containing protein